MKKGTSDELKEVVDDVLKKASPTARTTGSTRSGSARKPE